MRFLTRLGAAAVSGAAIMAGAGSALAAHGDECVRVVSYESSGEKLSMDPADYLSSDDAASLTAVYDRFLDVDDQFQVQPALAKSWEPSNEGRTWTFKLEEGVKFHDGTDFDSGDVVWTFTRLLDPETGSGAAASILDFLEADGIKAIDAHTVEFNTEDPIAELPLLLTTKFNLVVPEGHTNEELRLNGVGTGPFVQAQFEPGAPVRILEKNENYWVDGRPRAECLRITVITEPVTAVSALKSGEVDLVLSLDPAVIGALEGDDNVEILETGAGTSMTISFETDKPPFDDVRVRQALKAVVDRQAMVDTVLLGYGEPGNDNPVPPAWPSAYTSEIKPQDIDRARQLLAEAGQEDLEIDLYTSDVIPGMNKQAQLFQQMAAQAGITVNLQVTPADSYWDDIWMNRPAFMSGWSVRPPAVGLSVAYAKDSSWNETNWKNDEFQALLDKGKAEIDPEQRAEYLKQAQKLLSEEGGVIIPMFVHQLAGLRSNCDGFTPHAQNFNIDYSTLHCE